MPHAIIANQSPFYQSARIIEVPPDPVVAEALQRDATARRIMSAGANLEDGMLVGSRLNLNILKNHGVAVNTIHSATNRSGYRKNKGFWNGKVLAYQPVVQLRDAYFNVLQRGRERIATGQVSKYPMASVDGLLDLTTQWRFDGVEVRFNPRQMRLFCDKSNTPIWFAEHVTVTGHRAYVRGEIRYYANENEAPPRDGNAPCCVNFSNTEKLNSASA